ncbi:SDR family oxidoreductase [Planctomicrobium sp.]|jgi:UDP-glucose 4-epimerase|nr:SDR family oxidoreductase [Planctomicrobium sp.]MBT5018253.1 SDR family oxidoreductase [Planctomicrobium sp.]MDA7527365.1 SDR family oxidoreductase [bacterium]MDB4733144.1 SDR family oxidoreductase [Planctomicrobium sp.]MDB4743464.1 SDR family oxidoreductase [Planctomicrobium sp.]
MSAKLSTCLVTGGAGFIGSHIATRLVEQGSNVRILDNLSTGHLRNIEHLGTDVEFIKGDVSNAKVVREAVAGIDTVFHQAALPSVPLSIDDPIATHEACVTGAVNVLNESRLAGVRRVVYAGSSSAYGDNPDMPKRESMTPEVLSPYAAAKLATEYYCEAFSHSYDMEVVRLRYFNVFGPRQDPKSPYSAVIPLFAAALLEGRTPRIYGTGEQSRDFVYVGNVAKANLLAATVPGISGQVYNVASGLSITVLDLLHAICRHLGKPFTPEFHPPRQGDVLHSWAEVSRLKKELGYESEFSFEEGLKETLDFYCASVADTEKSSV